MKILLKCVIMYALFMGGLHAMYYDSIKYDSVEEDPVQVPSGYIVAYTGRTQKKQVYIQRFQNKTRERFRGHEFDINDPHNKTRFSNISYMKNLWLDLDRQYWASKQSIENHEQ